MLSRVLLGTLNTQITLANFPAIPPQGDTSPSMHIVHPTKTYGSDNTMSLAECKVDEALAKAITRVKKYLSPCARLFLLPPQTSMSRQTTINKCGVVKTPQECTAQAFLDRGLKAAIAAVVAWVGVEEPHPLRSEI